MNYPDWAPDILVELHQKNTEMPTPDDTPEHEASSYKELLESLGASVSQQEYDRVLLKAYQKENTLRGKEGNELLSRLLTYEDMRHAWNALEKRIKSDDDYLDFWATCQHGVIGWRGLQKMTPKERLKNLEDINKTAMKLVALLENTPEYCFADIPGSRSSDSKSHHPNFSGIISDRINPIYRRHTGTYTSESDPFYLFAKIPPDIISILMEISLLAGEYGLSKPLTPKPNSENAPVHYFVRYLSTYLNRRYNTPLHNAVACTASAIFDQIIDEDLVRKLNSQ